MDRNQKFFVVVAGNIGSGKTTLVKMLAERLQWRPYFESVEENPYLKDFYSDMKRWSFPLQVYFLNHRFHTHRFIENVNASCIQDRSIYEDAHIFARALHSQGEMSERDYETYLNLFNSMVQFLESPTIMIYLRRSVSKLVERIGKRGRDFEKNIDRKYLTDLNKFYDEWFINYDLGKKLFIDTDDLDFIENPEHFESLVVKMFDSIEQQQLSFVY